MKKQILLAVLLSAPAVIAQSGGHSQGFPISDGRQCGFQLTISPTDVGRGESGMSSPKENPVLIFAKLDNLNDFPVSYNRYPNPLRFQVSAMSPNTTWLPFHPEVPLTKEEVELRAGRSRAWGTRRGIIGPGIWNSLVSDLRESHDLQPGKHRVRAYMLRPVRADRPAQPHPTCPTPVWVQSNEIEIEVKK